MSLISSLQRRLPKPVQFVAALRGKDSRILLVFSLALLVGAGGLLPHFFLASDLGRPTFYEGAWDESFYALVMAGKVSDWNDYPARILDQWLMQATSGPNFLFAALSDFIWPALLVCAAGFLTLTITQSWIAVVPMIMLTIFATDILSFNSSAVYPPSLTLTKALGSLPLEAKRFFPDSFTPFLYAYRTPEPQLSLPFFLVHLAVTIRFLRQNAPGAREWILLCAVSFFCANIYVFFSAACLLATGASALSLFAVRNWRRAAGVLAIGIGCALWTAFRLRSSHSGEAGSLIFASSMPLLAPSLVYGVILSTALVWTFRRTILQDAELIFALLCILLPFATLNYQVLTGVMIQSLNWERMVNYPCLVAGASLFLSRLDWQRGWRRLAGPLFRSFPVRQEQNVAAVRPPAHQSWNARLLRLPHFSRIAAAVLFLGLSAAFVYRAQLGTYKQYIYYNLLTTASAQLIDQSFGARSGAARYVTLFDSSYDAGVQSRLQTDGVTFNAYSQLVGAMKEPANGGGSALQPQKIWGFEHAARLGFSRVEYEAKLMREVAKSSCWPHLMFHFSFLECAPYVSDFRAYFPDRLRQAVPAIGQQYENFKLSYLQGKPRGALVLLLKPSSSTRVNDLWLQEPAGSVKLSTPANGFAPPMSVTVYAYWQTPVE